MPHRILLRRLKYWFIYRVLHVDDTPHRIALGVAVGVFIAWTPSIPLQMVLTVAISTLLGANKFVGVPFVWISNPLTVVPIYGPNYLIGAWILGGQVQSQAFIKALVKTMDFRGGFFEVVQAWYEAMVNFLPELWLGSLIVATVLGLATYFVMLRVIIVYRRFRHRHDRKFPPSGPAEPPIGP
jgi:hypothetical protein